MLPTSAAVGKNRAAFQVSVVVTCYNLASYIEAAIQSVLQQTARDRIAEIIVVDDGSRDGSPAIIRRLAASQALIKPLLKDNGGASSARNAGIEMSSAPYIAFLDGDDVWKPEKLAVQIDFAERYPQAGLLFCDFEEVLFDPPRSQTVWVRSFSASDPDPLKKFFLKGGPILPSAALVRREVFDRCGLFDLAQKHLNDDEMWMRVANAFALLHTPGVLLTKRDVPGNISSNIEGRLQAMRDISERVYAMRPDLRRYAAIRSSRVSLQAGLGALRRGDTAVARRHFWQAAWLNPGSLRLWSYALLSLLPGDASSRLADAKALLGRGRKLAGGRSLAPGFLKGPRDP